MLYTLGGIVVVIVLLLLIFILPGFFLVGASEVGILTRKLGGNKLPQGHVVATRGENGLQAAVLMPGFYWKFWGFWSWRKVRVTVVPPAMVGIVESIDGTPIQAGRILGDQVECNNFQDASAFLANGGHRGVQTEILRPGTYRINTSMFTVRTLPAVLVPQDKIGVAVALDGLALPTKSVIAPVGDADAKHNHNHYQDGQAFIDGGGFKGTQLDTLQPGMYYINTALFEVKVFDLTEVAPGYVAVLRSNVGEELEKPLAALTDKSVQAPTPEKEIESLLTTDKLRRGIWAEPLAPGKYNLNPIAYSVFPVPTSAVTIDWASPEGRADTSVPGVIPARPGQKAPLPQTPDNADELAFFKFSQLRVTSKDGFPLEVDVRLIIRIPPIDASFVIARFGSVENLIEQIAHPLIDSSFRNKAGEKEALQFVQSRTDLQQEALDKAKEEFSKYHVEAQNLLIAYISVPTSLLDTQTQKQIAIQQQSQYAEQAAAQKAFIVVQEQTARAEKQKDVIAAELQIVINTSLANSAIETAKGTKESTKLVADGNAYAAQTVGEATAKAYTAKATAIGKDATYELQLMELIANGGVKIVPDIQVTGDNSASGLLSTFFAQQIGEKNAEKKAAK